MESKRPILLAKHLDGKVRALVGEGYQRWTPEELGTFPDVPPPPTTLHRVAGPRWFIEVADLCFEVTLAKLAKCGNDEMLAMPDVFHDGLAAVPPASWDESPPRQPPIELRGPREPVIVVSRELPPLRRAQFNVLKAVVDAYPRGMSLKELLASVRGH